MASTTPLMGFRIPDVGDQFSTLIAAIDNLGNDVDAALGTGTAWTSYTPTLTNGTGAATGRYVRVGKFITAHVSVVLSAALTGALSISLPVPATATNMSNATTQLGSGVVMPNSGSVRVPILAMYSTAAVTQIRVSDNTTSYGSIVNTSATAPFASASGDRYDAMITYEAA